MIDQLSPDVKPEKGSVGIVFGSYLLRALLVLSLIYYVAMVLDLVFHPLAQGVGYDAFFVERFLSVLSGTGVIVVGVFIMRRVSGNRIGPLLIIYGVAGVSWETRADWGSPLLTSLTHLLLNFYTNGIANVALIVLLLSFPTGQIYPHRATRWVAAYVTLLMIAITLVVMAQSPGGTVFFEGALPMNPFLVPALAPYYLLIAYGTVFLFILGIFATVISLILRYRTAGRREQQQIKWFVWVTAIVLAFTILIAAILIFDSNNIVLSSLFGVVLIVLCTQLLQVFPAIGIGIAILRHQLWEIDIIINRTLVYGSLTALLGLLYFALIFGLQFLFQGFVGRNNDVAIVISTLVIAALFQPLRRRLQKIVDRRFYRSKYDAAKIIESFSATLRNEVDLDHLSEHLVGVVQETMQPAHVSLWLRKPSKLQNQPFQTDNPSS
jgi:hypothetical protein